MIEKKPEHSNIRTIFFIENKPNPAGLYAGSWWIMSWDGKGDSVTDTEFRGVGQAAFKWHEKEEAEQYLRDLKEICPNAKIEYLYPQQKASSFQGLISRRRN